MLQALPAPRAQQSMDAWNIAAMRTVAGGQRQAAYFAFAYLAQLRAMRRAPSLERALEGVLVTRSSPVASSPVLRLWRLLDEGQEEAVAVTDAGNYAAWLSSNDLQVAQRGGLNEAASASGGRIVGWQKELSASACDWCQTVGAERLYSSADAVPFHANDTCGVSPVFGEE